MFRVMLILGLFSNYYDAHAFENKPSPITAKFNTCRDKNLGTFQKFVASKIGKGSSCRKDADCVYIPFGEGYVVNQETSDRQIGCIQEAHQAYFNYCLKKLPSKSYPLNELKFFAHKKRPTVLGCENNLCAARFDLPKRGPVDYVRKPATDTKSCLREFQAMLPK